MLFFSARSVLPFMFQCMICTAIYFYVPFPYCYLFFIAGSVLLIMFQCGKKGFPRRAYSQRSEDSNEVRIRLLSRKGLPPEYIISIQILLDDVHCNQSYY